MVDPEGSPEDEGTDVVIGKAAPLSTSRKDARKVDPNAWSVAYEQRVWEAEEDDEQSDVPVGPETCRTRSPLSLSWSASPASG